MIKLKKSECSFKTHIDSEEDRLKIRKVYKYFEKYSHTGLDIGEWIDFPIFIKILEDIGEKLGVNIIEKLGND